MMMEENIATIVNRLNREVTKRTIPLIRRPVYTTEQVSQLAQYLGYKQQSLSKEQQEQQVGYYILTKGKIFVAIEMDGKPKIVAGTFESIDTVIEGLNEVSKREWDKGVASMLPALLPATLYIGSLFLHTNGLAKAMAGTVLFFASLFDLISVAGFRSSRKHARNVEQLLGDYKEDAQAVRGLVNEYYERRDKNVSVA